MRRILTLVFMFTVLAFSFSGAIASAQSPLSAGAHYAAASDFKNGACEGISTLGGPNPCGGGTAAEDSLMKTVQKIIGILSMVIGIIAVIMIIVAGLKYVTSGGDSSKVSSAKNTLIYAIVGIVIVALAQFIVHFVLANI